MIRVKSLSFSHKGEKPPVLRGIDLKLEDGEVAALLGPNGSGKSTLFKCISGYWRAQEGEIYLGEKPLPVLSHVERAKLLAIVPQENTPAFAYRVEDMVLMGRAAHLGPFAAPGNKDREIVGEALEILGISPLKDREIGKLSGGERQMVLIARALAQKARILLLDEPTSHLDLKNQLHILEKVRAIAKSQGLTVLMTIHDPNLAFLFADRVFLLKEGEIIANGSPDSVINSANIHEVYGVRAEIVEFKGQKAVLPRV